MYEKQIFLSQFRTISPLSLVQIFGMILGMSILLLAPFSFFGVGMERTMLWIIGGVALLILMLPFFFRKKFDVFEPISFVILTVLFGVTLRSIYIAFFNNETINELLIGKDRDVLLLGGIVILLSLFFLVSGYMMKTPLLRLKKINFFRKDHWRTKRLFFVIFCFVCIGGIAMFLFIQKMGISFLVLSNISSKHFSVVEGSVYKFTSLGYYRWAASLTVSGFYLYMVWFFSSRKKWLSFWGLFAIGLGTMAAIFPFINSSRRGLITIIIFCLLFRHYLRKEISIRLIIWIVMIIIMLSTIMLTFRTRQVDNLEELVPYFTAETIIDQLVGSTNLFGIGKTGHIINAVPSKLPYQFGRTLLSIFFAPIPRSLWLEKPPVRFGAIIGQVVYETKDETGAGAGIPPGFVPELYINFGFPGVVLGMLLLGKWLRFLYNSFKPYLKNNKNAVILYVPLMYGSSFDLLGGDFTGVLINIITTLLPLCFALWFIGRDSQDWSLFSKTL